ncbi:MAG: phage integrase N-terminal SAM-like domain-containing protein, partial [Candidatus Thermoplasmatota archaeon]
MASELTPTAARLLRDFGEDLAAQALDRVTIQQYCGKVRRFLLFVGETDIETVSQETLKAYMAHLRHEKMQATTLMKQYVAIGSLFVYLEGEGKVRANPVPTFRRRYLKALKREAGKSEVNARQLISVDQMRALVLSLVDVR